MKKNYFVQIEEDQLANSLLAEYTSNQYTASSCKDSSLSLLSEVMNDEKLWLMLQVCLLLSSLRFHANLSQQFFPMGSTSDQERKYGLEKLSFYLWKEMQ